MRPVWEAHQNEATYKGGIEATHRLSLSQNRRQLNASNQSMHFEVTWAHKVTQSYMKPGTFAFIVVYLILSLLDVTVWRHKESLF